MICINPPHLQLLSIDLGQIREQDMRQDLWPLGDQRQEDLQGRNRSDGALCMRDLGSAD